MDVDETQLWARFLDERDNEAREDLYRHHSAWATSIAIRLFRQYRNPLVDREDYIQNAKVGLLEAMSRYQPDRGIPFRAFAQSRVSGSVLNGLRGLQDKLFAVPALNSLPEGEGGDSTDAFTALIDTIVSSSLGYLVEAATITPHGLSVPVDGFTYAKNSEIETRVRAALELLPGRHREILVCHYYQHESFQAIAARWSLTKGRISQLHHEALRLLRMSLRDLQ